MCTSRRPFQVPNACFQALDGGWSGNLSCATIDVALSVDWVTVRGECFITVLQGASFAKARLAAGDSCKGQNTAQHNIMWLVERYHTDKVAQPRTQYKTTQSVTVLNGERLVDS